MIKFETYKSCYCSKYHKGWYKTDLISRIKRKVLMYTRYTAFILSYKLYKFAITESKAEYTDPNKIQILHSALKSCNSLTCFGDTVKIVNQ